MTDTAVLSAKRGRSVDATATDREKRLFLSREKIPKILELATRGISNVEIAAITGVSERSICNTLSYFKRFLDAFENIEHYRNLRGSILTAIEAEYLHELVNTKKRAKAPLNQIAYAADIVYKMRRLEEGKSTANNSVHTTITKLASEIDMSKFK